MIQLWHPNLVMYNLCLDRSDASWYHNFLSALNDATGCRGGAMMMEDILPPAEGTIIRSL